MVFEVVKMMVSWVAFCSFGQLELARVSSLFPLVLETRKRTQKYACDLYSLREMHYLRGDI